MTELGISLKRVGYNTNCDNLVNTHNMLNNFFAYPNVDIIINDISSLLKSQSSIKFMEKFKGRLNDRAIEKSQEEINMILQKIRLYMSQEQKEAYILRIFYDYLKELEKLANYDADGHHCNIIDIYLKYNDIIHLMMMYEDPSFHKPEEYTLFSDMYLFKRCFYTVRSFLYLIGESNIIEQKNTYKENRSYTHKYQTPQNKFSLIRLISSLMKIPSYYLLISIQHSIFDHVFVIVKYDDNGVSKYMLIQSYVNNYCPSKKVYTFAEIKQFLLDISSIFYDDKRALDSVVTENDIEIWNKYFFANMTKESLKNTNMCFEHCVSYVYGIINDQLCYTGINKLIGKTKHTIYSYLNELILPLGNKLGYDIKSFQSMIPISNFISVGNCVRYELILNDHYVGYFTYDDIKNAFETYSQKNMSHEKYISDNFPNDVDSYMDFIRNIGEQCLNNKNNNENNDKQEYVLNHLFLDIFPDIKKIGLDYCDSLASNKYRIDTEKINCLVSKNGTKLSWDNIIGLYDGMPMWEILTYTYKIYNVQDFYNFLTVLSKIIDLRNEISPQIICPDAKLKQVAGSIIDNKYDDDDNDKAKYLKNKRKYLSLLKMKSELLVL